MKRSWITRKPTQRKIDFKAELDAMRPIIHARSKGVCEAERIVTEYTVARLTAAEDPEAILHALDAFRAVVCWKRASEVHHRKFISRGGTNAEDNLADICYPHHAFAHRHGGFGRYGNLVGLALTAGQKEEL